MTPYEAAQRLGVHETAVRTVEQRASDCVVTLRDDRKILVTETVARPYVPEVDDAPAKKPAKAVVEQPDEGIEEEAEDKPKTPAKRTQGKAK